MNYIIYDLEFNQKYIDKSIEDETNTHNSCPFEIIQIGAIKLDDNFNIISTFNEIIKPVIYPVIHPYVEKITNLNDSILSNGKDFKTVFDSFLKFIDSPSDCILCVWGTVDLRELFRNITYYNLSSKNFPKKYINVQKYASNFFNSPKGTNIGLKNAIELLGIPMNIEFHNAFNDALYTVDIFKTIYSEEMTPSTYSIEISNRKTLHKTSLDEEALINQFVKMFNRPFSSEEISIIKLAYIMGKTNQFQK